MELVLILNSNLHAIKSQVLRAALISYYLRLNFPKFIEYIYTVHHFFGHHYWFYTKQLKRYFGNILHNRLTAVYRLGIAFSLNTLKEFKEEK